MVALPFKVQPIMWVFYWDDSSQRWGDSPQCLDAEANRLIILKIRPIVSNGYYLSENIFCSKIYFHYNHPDWNDEKSPFVYSVFFYKVRWMNFYVKKDWFHVLQDMHNSICILLFIQANQSLSDTCSIHYL